MVWMYRRYVIPSLHYDLAVNGISVSISKKLNSLATRYIKKWLGLTRSTTVNVIHHPSVLNILTLESCSTSAKLNYLAAVTLSPDRMIAEISYFSLLNSLAMLMEFMTLPKTLSPQPLNLFIPSAEKLYQNQLVQSMWKPGRRSRIWNLRNWQYR